MAVVPAKAGTQYSRALQWRTKLPPVSPLVPGLLDARFRGHDSREAWRDCSRALSLARKTDGGGKAVSMNVLSLRRHDPDQVQRVPAVRGGSLSSLPELPSERR